MGGHYTVFEMRDSFAHAWRRPIHWFGHGTASDRIYWFTLDGSSGSERSEREAVGGAAFISALAACVSGNWTGLVARIPPSLPDTVAQCFGPGGLMRGGIAFCRGSVAVVSDCL